MSDNQTNAILKFENVEFDVVERRGVPWLKSSQIAMALGYADESAVTRLHARNEDEFTEEMSLTVNLTVKVGENMGVNLTPNIGEKVTRIFSPRGCHLVAMLANTERAKAFRVWVLDVLEGKTPPRQSGRLKHADQLKAHGLRLQLIDRLRAEQSPAIQSALHAQYAQISSLLGLTAAPVEDFSMAASTPEESPAVQSLWVTINAMDANPATRLNHSHRPEQLFCLNVKAFLRLAGQAKVTLPPKPALFSLLKQSKNPRFVGTKAVYSAITGHSVKCFVFRF